MSDENVDKACTLTLADGTHYDLNPLSSAKGDYETIVNEAKYKLNVCRSVVSELWKVDDPDNVAGFVNREEGDFSLGSVNTTLHISPQSNDPILYLSNGSPCPYNAEEKASTAIRFICTPSIFEAGTPQLVAALPPLDSQQSCHFFFEWKTHVACPTNPKSELASGHYIAFFSILFIAILTWFAGHTLFNRFFLKKRGMEQFPVPNVSVPKVSLPNFKKSSGSSKPSWGFGRRSQRNGGYSVMNQDETQHFVGRYSLSDDDEDQEHADLTGGAEDARVLGGEAREWRGQSREESREEERVGIHQGLINV